MLGMCPREAAAVEGAAAIDSFKQVALAHAEHTHAMGGIALGEGEIIRQPGCIESYHLAKIILLILEFHAFSIMPPASVAMSSSSFTSFLSAAGAVGFLKMKKNRMPTIRA